MPRASHLLSPLRASHTLLPCKPLHAEPFDPTVPLELNLAIPLTPWCCGPGLQGQPHVRQKEFCAEGAEIPRRHPCYQEAHGLVSAFRLMIGLGAGYG